MLHSVVRQGKEIDFVIDRKGSYLVIGTQFVAFFKWIRETRQDD